ncbi:MAG: tRNA pseudouridine(38-40) synthase TruA [Proteobacteria bacterium]|nr:tRNA pseudouridine(38-40) synthase TruA [Pseudomonadota bacterium]MDA1058493.1 tRNA pseudouridine(38-40) synthase TruA [Pseudomonadota bacterium]
MSRYKLTLEYDGRPFVGWQRQKRGDSVQAALERAVLALSGEAVTVFGAGRTDAGVHATGQVAHFDMSKSLRWDTVRDGLNYHLKPQPIAVLLVEPVDDTFHARFSAKGRVYQYLILARRAPAALDRAHVWHVPVVLDDKAMHRAAQGLVGQHDFTSFRAGDCQAKSPVRTLDRLAVERTDDLITITACARSFLRSQVRVIVGSIKLVGEGHWAVDDVARALERRDRSAAGPTAPADGLYLRSVRYVSD